MFVPNYIPITLLCGLYFTDLKYLEFNEFMQYYYCFCFIDFVTLFVSSALAATYCAQHDKTRALIAMLTYLLCGVCLIFNENTDYRFYYLLLTQIIMYSAIGLVAIKIAFTKLISHIMSSKTNVNVLCIKPLNNTETDDRDCESDCNNNVNNIKKLDMPLGDRMKHYESEAKKYLNIDADKWYVIRLDGVAFSKFTCGFRKPFDPIFTNAMIETMHDLLAKYNPVIAYTHSDEITLVFNAQVCENATHPYNGNPIKLCSIYASYTNLRFQYHLQKNYEKTLPQATFTATDAEHDILIKLGVRINEMQTSFDARIAAVYDNDTKYEIANYFIWRSTKDCYRNCVSAYARSFFSTKTLHGLNSAQKKERMLQKDFNFEKCVHCYLKYGMFAKKQFTNKLDAPTVSDSDRVAKIAKNIAQQRVEPNKPRAISFSIPQISFSQEFVNFIYAKYYNQTHKYLVNQNIHYYNDN